MRIIFCTVSHFKKTVLEACVFLLQKKIELLAYSLREISESMENETKSSVGDKHETARARMQFEQEKLKHQLLELKEQANELQRIDLSAKPVQLGFGTLVTTNKGLFFISIPLGKIEVEEKEIYVISLSSPLGQALKSKVLTESLRFNGSDYQILGLD